MGAEYSRQNRIRSWMQNTGAAPESGGNPFAGAEIRVPGPALMSISAESPGPTISPDHYNIVMLTAG
ncbi:protein of unknown function (plasmid) [Cupriavidus neocaledonicus]|uniref:Uncharacterized protein n=1 Tax=Cupriavidus neocaledonicus TaxID=1040979 RepID=A0A375HNP2_9BURK|nr:protein of unknown function [Cupriavidus neocaledonicus]